MAAISCTSIERIVGSLTFSLVELLTGDVASSLGNHLVVSSIVVGFGEREKSQAGLVILVERFLLVDSSILAHQAFQVAEAFGDDR